MADHKGNEEKNTQPKSMGAAAGAHSSAQGDPNARTNTQDTNSMQTPNAARGGRQEDQLSGETQRGARNNETRGANPQGSKR